MKIRFKAGQAFVEFAFLLPIIILLVFGAIEFGRAFQAKIVLENAAREGSHYMIYDNDFYNTKTAAVNESTNSGVYITQDDVTVQCLTNGELNTPATDCPRGSTVEVIISIEFESSLLELLANPFKIEGNARMLVP